MKEIELQLDLLDDSDRSFAFSCGRDASALMRSLQAAGQLMPIAVRERAGGDQLVHGWQRAACLRALGADSVKARVFSADELPDRSAFDLYFWDNAATRSFNFIEAGRIVLFLHERLKLADSEIIARYLPALGLTPARKILGWLLDLQKLEPPWQELIASTSIPLGQVQVLLGFTADDRQTLWPLLAELRPGSNKLREMLALLQEIASRDRLPVTKLLDNSSITEVLNRSQLSRPQKVEVLLAALRRLRNPRLFQARRRFDQAVARLSLPDGVRLSPASDFEDSTVALQFRFASPEQLRLAAEKLLAAAASDNLRKLFEPG